MGPTSINTLVLVKYAAHSVMGVSLRKQRSALPDTGWAAFGENQRRFDASLFFANRI